MHAADGRAVEHVVEQVDERDARDDVELVRGPVRVCELPLGRVDRFDRRQVVPAPRQPACLKNVKGGAYMVVCAGNRPSMESKRDAERKPGSAITRGMWSVS